MLYCSVPPQARTCGLLVVANRPLSSSIPLVDDLVGTA